MTKKSPTPSARHRLADAFLSAFGLLALVVAGALTSVTVSAEEATAERMQSAEAFAADGAAASNPLASVNNIDLKWTYFRLNDRNESRRNNYWIKGSAQLSPAVKLSYELNYQETNITGSSESDWESLRIKPIFFIKSGSIGSWKYRMATGFEWILDFDNREKGIGSGADQISPLFGVALQPRKGTTLVPLVQHFVSYSGPDVNTTGLRFIAIQRLPDQFWAKADLIAPYDWERDTLPATAEVELGKMLNNAFGIYVSGLSGVGGDRTLDWGASLNVRYVY